MIKAVIFDLDDTLYCELDYVRQGFRHVAEYLATEVLFDGMDEADTIFERMCELLAQQGRGKIFDVICEEWKLDVPVKELVAVYRDTAPELSLYEDAQEIIDYVKSIGIQTGIITDGCSQVQHHKLNALPLTGRIDEILATDDLGKDAEGKSFCKPNPAVYEYVLNRLECAPENALYIGDNPQKDFIGAKELGMKTVRIIREVGDHMKDVVEKEYEADIIIHNLAEIRKYI